MRSLTAAVLAGVLALLPATGHALLCTNKKGAVSERTACKRKEAILDLTAAGATGPKGDAGSDGASLPRLRAFDATGRAIGYVNGIGFVVVVQDGRAIEIPAGDSGFQPFGYLFFAEPACTGASFVGSFGLLITSASVHDGTAYYAGEPIADHAYQSVREPTLAPPFGCMSGSYDVATGLCCSASVGTTRSGPATPLELGGFAAPFHVEVER